MIRVFKYVKRRHCFLLFVCFFSHSSVSDAPIGLLLLVHHHLLSRCSKKGTTAGCRRTSWPQQLGVSDGLGSVGTARCRQVQLTSACIPASLGRCCRDELWTDADRTEPFRAGWVCCWGRRASQRLSSFLPSAGRRRSPSALLLFHYGHSRCFFFVGGRITRL